MSQDSQADFGQLKQEYLQLNLTTADVNFKNSLSSEQEQAVRAIIREELAAHGISPIDLAAKKTVQPHETQVTGTTTVIGSS